MDEVNSQKSSQNTFFCTLTSLLILTWFLTACQIASPTPFIPPDGTTPLPTGVNTVSPDVIPTLTDFPPATPTNTPIPLALTVNGEGITLPEYQASLARLLAAQLDLAPETARTLILDDFTDQLLLSQAAARAGFIVDAATLNARYEALLNQLGGQEALQAWMTANGYTDEFFRFELRRSIAAAWMRDQIIAIVPLVAEQVHARQLLLFSNSEAQDVLSQLTRGVPFENMLAFYDPIGLGELGWFPRGYLTETAIEETAFALEVNKYSQVIETHLGFHIIQLLERQEDRPLDPDVRLALQEKELIAWLAEQRLQSEITIQIP